MLFGYIKTIVILDSNDEMKLPAELPINTALSNTNSHQQTKNLKQMLTVLVSLFLFFFPWLSCFLERVTPLCYLMFHCCVGVNTCFCVLVCSNGGISYNRTLLACFCDPMDKIVVVCVLPPCPSKSNFPT